MNTRSDSTTSFFVIAYAWSWLWWTPMVLTLRSRGIADLSATPSWASFVTLIGGFGPTVAALVLTARSTGRAGVRELLRRLWRWRAPWPVHLLIWLGPPLFLVLAMLAAPAKTALLGQPVWSRLALVPMALLLAVPFGPLGEELGWRGFALPRLQQRRSALAASLLIGVAWCFWHTPLFWAPSGTKISGYAVTLTAVAKYLAHALGASILYTWVYNRSRGSVALAVALHASGNAILPMLPFPARDRAAALFIKELAVVPLWIVAISLVVVCGARRLGRPHGT